LENPIPKGDGKNWLYSGGITRSYSSRGVGTYFECSMKANQTEMSSTFWLKPRPTCKKNLELDIQECVGVMSPDATAKLKWDNIYHSNMFNFRNENCSEIPDSHLQDWKILDEKNSDRFFTYGCYLESSTKAHFYLDGVYQYTMTAERPFDEPMHIVLAIETYDWNMPPKGGGMIANGDFNERTTRYDWIRTWELIDNSNGMVNNESQETILFPIEDAYIGNDKCYDNSNLRVEHSEKQKISYLKFNLSDVSGKISSAKLRLTSTTYGKGVFNVHLANKTDWKETTLDNSNKPIATKILGAYKGKVKNGEAYSWELDATAIENLNELNMIISQLDTDDKNNAQFASKENSNTAALPQLVLTLGNNETTTTDNNYSFIIEAENFNKTGGNFDDNNAGGPGYGVLRNSKTISHVNNEDWVEYTANVKSAGTYKIEYLVATPSDNANIQLSIDGAEVLNTKISNMYTWDNMKWINGKETVYISKGKHNFNIKAVGSTWQWNLDKIKLIHTSQNKLDLSTKTQ